MRFPIVASVLLMYTLSVNASTINVNLLNVFYFEHASVSAADCASRGFPTKSIYSDWLVSNKKIHDRISRELMQEFTKMGLSENEAENNISVIRNKYRIQSSKEARPSKKICGAFREYLSSISTLRDSKYSPTH
jgi:hypothetical protein